MVLVSVIFGPRAPLMGLKFAIFWSGCLYRRTSSSGLGHQGCSQQRPQETRRQISAEELRFAIRVVAYEPWGQLAASLRNAGAQLTLLGLDEFEYTTLEKAVFEAKVPHEHLQSIKQSAAYHGAMPVAVFSILNAATFLI